MMKFKVLTKILHLAFLTMLSSASYGQNRKNSFIINLGFHQTDTYQKLFYNLDNTEPIYPTKQLSAAFFDVNFLYSIQTKNPKLKCIFGVGFNQKGFGENGMASDGSPNYYSYVSKLKNTYLSFYGGLSYDLYSRSKTRITIVQLLNPEIDLNNTDLYKKVPFATRTNLTFARKVADNFSLLLTPYFQTALTKYNKTKLANSSSNYVPYGFGLNFGLLF